MTIYRFSSWFFAVKAAVVAQRLIGSAFESFGVYEECAPGILAKPILLRDPTCGYALDMDLDEVIKLEMKLLESSVRKSPEELNSLLSPGFIEFGTSGQIYNRKIIVERLAEELPTQIEALDFEGVFLAPAVVQLRFKTRRKNPDGTVSASLRSSIWKHVHGRWQMFFHQGTATTP